MLWLLTGSVLDCPRKGLSAAPDGLDGQYLQESALDGEKRVGRLQDEVFLEQGSLQSFLEQGSSQSLERSCGRVG